MFEARLRPVRGRSRAVTSRGAFKLYVGATEVDARLRFYGSTKLAPGEEAFARITAAAPVVLDVGDRFVLREAGRRETVAGGTVLDVAPPARAGHDPVARLSARASAPATGCPRCSSRSAGRSGPTTSSCSRVHGGRRCRDRRLARRRSPPAEVEAAVVEALATYHAEHPLDVGAALTLARSAVTGVLRAARAPTDPALVDALLTDLSDRGITARDTTTVRLTSHRVALQERSTDVERLLTAIGGEREATPPTVKELVAAGVGRDVIDAAAREGLVVRVSSDLVMTTDVVARAEATIRASAATGITVSALRESLGTSRKYAVPLLEWFDQRGVTRRDGEFASLANARRNRLSPAPPRR